jgi:uncharacterized small protein (DUF1192 family)
MKEGENMAGTIREIEKLEEGASLSKIISKISELKSCYAEINNSLIDYLGDKEIDIAEGERTLSMLVTKLENYASNILSGKDSLDNQKAILEEEIAALNAQITPLNNQISTLNSQVTSLNNEVSSLNSRVTSLNNEINGTKASIIAQLNRCGTSGSSSETVSYLAARIGDAVSNGAGEGTGGGTGSGSSSGGSTSSKPTGSTSGFSYTVSTVSGGYSFSKKTSGTYNGYYVSSSDVDNEEYALCKVAITNSSRYNLFFQWIVSSEEGYDEGCIGTSSSSFTSSNCIVYQVSGEDSGYVSIGTSSSMTYYVIYEKDVSSYDGNDCFAFKVTR